MGDGIFNASTVVIGDDGIVRFNSWQTEGGAPWATNQFIDLSQSNAVTDAIHKIVELSNNEINNNQHLQELLKKPEWGYDDAAQWESISSAIVSKHYDGIQGLGDYRFDEDPSVTRVTDLKDISPDLENNTQHFENDCETMRSIDLIAMTLIEKDLVKRGMLNRNPVNENDYKYHAPYAAVNGGVKYSIDDPMGGHAWGVSTKTGNIFEGTADPNDLNLFIAPSPEYYDVIDHSGRLPYNDTGKNFSYADLIAGKLATTQLVELDDPRDPSTMQFSIAVYGSYEGSGDASVISQREEIIKKGHTHGFEGLKKALFNPDSDTANDRHFESGFYQQGKTSFTVKKPTPEDVGIPDQGKYLDSIEGSAYFIENVYDGSKTDLDGLENLSKTSYDDAFFGRMYDLLDDNGFTEGGKPTILTTEDGKSFLLRENGEDNVEVYDVTEVEIENANRLDFETVEPDPEPTAPDPVKICSQPMIGNVFEEIVDGKGILNENQGAYNDAHAIKDMVEAAKGLGLSEENVYGHIEEAMDEGKFLGTAASIKAITASHAALKQAQGDGLNQVDQERMVMKTFFENITAEDLITDTVGQDDKALYTESDLARAKEMAEEIKNDLSSHYTCQVSELKGAWIGNTGLQGQSAQNEDLTRTSPSRGVEPPSQAM